MNSNQPKYSILIPTYNGINYLPTCLETILNQKYNDYELIISDDHSTDGTKEYLKDLSDPNITVIEPETSLSMTEHWEWLLSHAIGEWCIFVGQDDGLQPYFFELADKLTVQANAKNIRTIMSSRAYFFWQGCEYVYGNVAVRYVAFNKTKIHNFKIEALKALLGLQDYFELPQMYTTALFHKKLIAEAKLKQQGKVFSCHPQDANLAAIACSLENKYLKSYMPLGWVGSSPKSAGMAVTGQNSLANEKDKSAIEQLKKDYIEKISKSNLNYHELAGDFSFGNAALYFWQALLMTASIRSSVIQQFLTSKFFKLLMFSSIFYSLQKKKLNLKKKQERLQQFEKILLVNKCKLSTVKICLVVISLIIFLFLFPTIVYKVFKKAIRFFSDKIKLLIVWDENAEITMNKASSNINIAVKNKHWISSM